MVDMYLRVGGTWMHQLGIVENLTWTDVIDTGSSGAKAGQTSGGGGFFHTCSWSIPTLNPNFTHPSLVRGNLVELFAGAVRVGQGILAEPDRENWSFTADGLNKNAANVPCIKSVASVLSITSVPNDVYDYGVSFGGLGWRARSATGLSISTAPVVKIKSTGVDDTIGQAMRAAGITSLKELLDTYCANLGQFWYVDENAILRIIARPSGTPMWAFVPDSVILGTADDEYFSEIIAEFALTVDATTGLVLTTGVSRAANAIAAARFGTKIKQIDLVPLGLLSQVNADLNTAARLAGVGARMGYTNKVNTDSRHLTSLGGTQACLEMVRPGQMMRMYNLDDTNGNLRFGAYEDVAINAVTHETDGTITIEPFGFVGRDVETFVADAVAPQPAA